MRRTLAGSLLALMLAGCGSSGDSSDASSSGSGSGSGGSGGSAPDGIFIRMNQVGFTPDDDKRALLMTARPPADDAFAVTKAGAGARGQLGGALGAWSPSFGHLFAMNIGATGQADDYRLSSNGAATTFRIADASELYAPLLANAALFYRAQRDGADVDASVLDRKPSHLADRTASVYDPPRYVDDVLKTKLVPVSGATVDVEGGWFDAGDYLKFVETTSYTTAVMLLAARDYPAPIRAAHLDTEAKVGLAWLAKMSDLASGTFFYQVGIGDGHDGVGGDHDFWRLPEKDDARAAKKGDFDYFVQHRPLFRVGPPGTKLSPNLAGRLAASFALAAQVSPGGDALAKAAAIFELADESPKGDLVTASPFDYYPETEWRDDLELGAAEIYLAIAASPGAPSLPHPAAYYLERSAYWARKYLDVASGSDSLNLYDVSALAHRELAKAIDAAGSADGLEVTRADLAGDLRAQLEVAVEQSRKDPFGFGIGYGDGDDAAPHALGLVITARYYAELAQKDDFATFAAHQRDWLFGANAWGASFVIGAGVTSPQCPQHQIANLVGKPLLGGVVDGPSAAGDFEGLGRPDGVKRCPPDGGDAFQRFSGKGARFEDNVVAWPSVEPSIDYTALSVLFFAGEMI